jgi:hypothetical protein
MFTYFAAASKVKSADLYVANSASADLLKDGTNWKRYPNIIAAS